MDIDLFRLEADGLGDEIAAAPEILRSVPNLEPVAGLVEACDRVQRLQLCMVCIVTAVFALVDLRRAAKCRFDVALLVEDFHRCGRVCMDCRVARQRLIGLETVDFVLAPSHTERAPSRHCFFFSYAAPT